MQVTDVQGEGGRKNTDGKGRSGVEGGLLVLVLVTVTNNEYTSSIEQWWWWERRLEGASWDICDVNVLVQTQGFSWREF